jgi:RHS repeat-associated protein
MTAGPTPGSEDNAQHLKYDAWNRLVEVDDQRPSLIATYRYDGLGRRISKTLASGDVTDYYYDEAWQVLQEYTVAANQTETVNVYVWDLRYIDAPVVRATYNNDTESLDNWLYYCNDANMNVTSLVASVQGVPTVVERYTYTPYGQPTFRQADGSLTHVSGHADGTASALAVANEILYCGYRYDTETGLYHVRHRAYHSTVGRWMQRDPITLDGSGWYRYVEDRPLDRTDAGGLAAAPPKNGVVTNCFAGCAARYYYCMGCTSVGAGKLSTTLWVFTSWEYSGGEACRHCLWTCLSKCKKEGVPAFPCCMSGCDNGRLTAVSAQNPQQTVVKGLKETVGYIIADAGADAATKGAGGTVGLTAILQGIGMAPDLFDAWMKLQIKDYLLEHNLAASMNMDLLYADPDFVYTLIMSLQNRGMLRVAPYIIQTKQFPFSGRF